jgi:hypothetical protein
VTGVLVDPEVTKLKFERELELWDANAGAYRRRGWIRLGQTDRSIDVGFLAKLPLGGSVPVPCFTASVRIDFTNFDLWAPSVEFINPLDGTTSQPLIQALVESEEGPRNLVIGGHPATGRPFFCLAGVREYHTHPQHSGDSWLLRRETGDGSLATICDRIWRSMARNLLGLQVNLQTLPGQIQFQLRLTNAPGDAAQLFAAQAQEDASGAEGL